MVIQTFGRYVTILPTKYNGEDGALVQYSNPRFHPVNKKGINEFLKTIKILQNDKKTKFAIFHTGPAKHHLGANVKEFDGEVPPTWALKHTLEGSIIPSMIEELKYSRGIITVGILDEENRYGGSVEWPLWSEYVVASDKTRLQVPEIKLNLIPGWAGISRMENKMFRYHPQMSKRIAAQYSTLAEFMNAEEAYRFGLLDVPPVPQSDIIEVACKLATYNSVDELNDEINEKYYDSKFAPREINKTILTAEELVRGILEAPSFIPWEIDRSIFGPSAVKEIDDLVYNVPSSKISKTSILGEIRSIPEFGERGAKVAKEILDYSGLERFDQRDIVEAIKCARLMLTEDRKEGVRAFLEKRAPQFKGEQTL